MVKPQNGNGGIPFLDAPDVTSLRNCRELRRSEGRPANPTRPLFLVVSNHLEISSATEITTTVKPAAAAKITTT